MNKQMSSALAQGDHTPVVLIGTQEFMGKEIPVIVGGFGEDNKVVTDKMVAEIHNTEAREVRRLIKDNLKRFKKSIDFIDLKQPVGDTHTLDLTQFGYSKQAITQAEHIYLLSERGYSKLIKIMDTDLAWEIHDNLMDDYFKLREAAKNTQYSYMIDDPIERAKAWIKEQEEKKLIELENSRNKKLLEEQEPKVAFANAITASKNSILVRELARLISQNGIKLGERRLYDWLRLNGYVEKYSTKATQKAINLKVLELVERTNQDKEGNLHTNFTTYVTAKGQAYFIGKFLERK